MSREGIERVIAIFGPPGAGKTTVARALADVLGAVYVSSGDIARAVDPEALERGEMADRDKLRRAFAAAMDGDNIFKPLGVPARFVVDGLPRDRGDVDWLPAGETLFLLLTVAPTIGIDRQVRRGRPGDTFELADKRTTEQRALMELDVKGGWAHELAGWKGALQTNDKRPEHVIRHVTEYVLGKRKTLA